MKPNGIDTNLERELNSIRQEVGKWPEDSITGMAQLVKSETGKRGAIVTMRFALYYTTLNPEWRYEEL